jgi:Pentapeptide repeats (8 copies)
MTNGPSKRGNANTIEGLATELGGTEAVAREEQQKLCFAVMPISKPRSRIRRRSDQVLQHIIRPTAEKLGYKTERSDLISQPGSIVQHIMQRLRDAELVVADLTDLNPNVFYELGIRHMIGKPVVQMMEDNQPIPFDVAQLRTIKVNCRNRNTFQRHIETYKEELENHIRSLETNPGDSTPLSIEIETGQQTMADEQGDRLREHIDYLSDLLINRQLREAAWDSPIRVEARTRTLVVLPLLDKQRKRDLLRFLHEAALIKKEDPYRNYEYPVIGLDSADLSNANLSYINLSGDALYSVDMKGSDLGHANLSYTNLRGIDLSGANLRNADLGNADLSRDLDHDPRRHTNLRNANFTDAHLVNAVLTDADFSGADLSYANLKGANVTEEQLAKCESLEGATLPDGSNT